MWKFQAVSGTLVKYWVLLMWILPGRLITLVILYSGLVTVLSSVGGGVQHGVDVVKQVNFFFYSTSLKYQPWILARKNLYGSVYGGTARVAARWDKF